MKITSVTIRKLTDFVLLNAYTLSSSGLYEGKAGHALYLFESARRFEHARWAEQATGILQEALVSQTEEIDFGSGLSGIGYTLLYAIRHGFVEAGFHDLFGEQTGKILTDIRSADAPFRYLDIVPFLMEYSRFSGGEPEADGLIRSVLNDSFRRVEQILADGNWHEENRKDVWISFLRSLFRSLFLLGYHRFDVAYDAAALQRVGVRLDYLARMARLQLSDDIRFYRSGIPALSDGKGYHCPVIDPMESKVMDLALTVRLNVMQSFSGKRFHWAGNPLEGLTDETVEAFLDFRIGRNQRLCSFYSGAIRFLLYCLYAEEGRSSQTGCRLTDLMI